MLLTTITGSLPKPAWLARPETLWAPWQLPGDRLLEGQRDAVLVALKEQERAGIDIVTDGEQGRQHFVHGFLERLEGIDFGRRVTIGIRADRYKAEVPTVTGPLRRVAPVHREEALWARAHTDRRLKFTIPGPMTIVDTLADEHYRDRARLAMDFARVINEEARDLVAAAKAQPGKLSYASVGAGSPHHLAMELIKHRTGAFIVHIPYRGAAPAVQDVLGNQLPVMVIDTAVGLPHIRAGKLVPLGVLSRRRLPALPDVPTLQEQGIGDTEVYAWQGLVVPAATPRGMTDCMVVACASSVASWRASPKSMIFSQPACDTSALAALTSRWITRSSCA